ncbi:MAG: hypothetical protein RLZZ488_1936 [Pseudomonadota bacterium]|jgi:hypothetical protein
MFLSVKRFLKTTYQNKVYLVAALTFLFSNTSLASHSRCVIGEDWHRLCDLPNHPSPVCSVGTLGGLMCKDSIQCRLDVSCAGEVPSGYFFVSSVNGKSFKCRC